MKKIFLYASLVLAAGLLFTNMYNSIVDARSWGADIPQSIQTARNYFASADPGDFYRVFSPINQVLGLLCLILFWKASKKIRLYLGIAFILYVAGDMLTFAFFYPRNDIMFETASLTDTETIRKAWSEWSSMNWLRTLIVFTGVIFSSLALHNLYIVKRSL